MEICKHLLRYFWFITNLILSISPIIHLKYTCPHELRKLTATNINIRQQPAPLRMESSLSHCGTGPLPLLSHVSHLLSLDCFGFYFQLFPNFNLLFLIDCASSEKVCCVGIFPLCVSARFSCCLIWGSWDFPLGSHFLITVGQGILCSFFRV